MNLTDQQMKAVNEVLSDPELDANETVFQLHAMIRSPNAPLMGDIVMYLEHELQQHGRMWKDEYVAKVSKVARILNHLRCSRRLDDVPTTPPLRLGNTMREIPIDTHPDPEQRRDL